MTLTPLERELQKALGPILLKSNVQVFPRRRENEELEKYLVFTVLAKGETEFANDKAIFQSVVVEVNYFAPKSLYDEKDIETVIKSMKGIEFSLTSEITPIEVEKIEIEGANMEFSREQVV